MTKNQQTQKVTLSDLAGMVKRGFDAVDKRFDVVDKRFDEVNHRLDRIEGLALTDHQRRIEKLEVDMKHVKDIFAVK